ncbi:FG-GAP-like repeat-containing protein [Streptomyces narbonensis]|uniref:FG-GAP-like repeat-containing protein n=1 Tax=Streptomyces narbonensis TaxID=67333 RepID=UPI001E58409D|nr:FG-GAP-like repeat-containing protein [Streptomyces narbonensis]
MTSAFFGRARRVTTCTALALSAGMLLASPAVAEPAEPGPRTFVKQAPRDDSTTPVLDMSQPAVEQGTARTAAATAVVRPRFDVTGDGKTDLVHRRWTGWTFVAPSNGAAATVFDEPHGSGLSFDLVPLGDQNGTGKPELLTLAEDGVLRLYSESTLTGGSITWSGKGWTLYNKIFSPGDISGDGKADLLARQHNGDLYYYRWTGAASAPFAGRVKIGGGWGVYDQLVGVGDNSGDGRGDVVARTTDGKLYFYGSTGDPRAPFKPRRELGKGWNTYNQILAPDDRNGDGRADLLARDAAGALWAYSGLGNGSYSARAKLSGSWFDVDQFASAGNVPTNGKRGILARDKAGTVFEYRHRNGGKLGARDQVGPTGYFAGASVSFASALDPGPISDLLEVYQGHLYSNGSVDLGGGWQIYNLIVGPGDLTGDGKADLVARDRTGVLYLYPGNGKGTAVASRIRVGDGWSAYNRVLGAGDFSGDGRTDLLARDGSGTLWLYRGTGSATAPFAKRVSLGGGWNTYNKLAAPGDMSGDGKADLLAVNSAGDLYRYLGTGTGATLTPRVKIGYGYQTYGDLY